MWELLLLLFIFLSMGATVFWIFMLIDCSTQEVGANQWRWVVIIVMTHSIGALVYYYYQRPKRLAAFKKPV